MLLHKVLNSYQQIFFLITLILRILECQIFQKNPPFSYSSLPNKRTGWNFDKNQISVQGGIWIKILEYRVKTGNFIDN